MISYHALRKQDAISFMPRRQKGGKGFTNEQLVALKTYALLRTYGLTSKAAAEAVEAFFPKMRRLAAGDGSGGESAYIVRVRIMASGKRLFFTHLDDAQEIGVMEVGHIELDLRSIAALLNT